jgi:hypothetical protein
MVAAAVKVPIQAIAAFYYTARLNALSASGYIDSDR